MKSTSTDNLILMSVEEARPIFQNIPFIVGEISEHRKSLMDGPTGLGKSVLVDLLLASNLVHEKWDLVIYISNRWDIIGERELVKDPGKAPVGVVVVEGRPKDRCGKLDPEWRALEEAGAISHGRNTLCRSCPNNTEAKPCPWVKSFLARVGEARVVFFPEQVLKTNPTLLMHLSRGKPTLVIADEAQFTATPFAKKISRLKLEMFRQAINQVPEIPADVRVSWLQSIDQLKGMREWDLSKVKLKLPTKIHEYGASIQEVGLKNFKEDFRYLAYDIESFQRSRFTERWLNLAGEISFRDRPFLNVDMLFLSAHLTPTFIEHRLGLEAGEIHRILPNIKVSLHPGTKVYNLIATSGSKLSIKERDNGKSSFDHLAKLFTAMVVRNIKRGKSTLLVTCKEFKEKFADRLQSLLSDIHYEVTFITEDYHRHQLEKPNPLVIPIIHYGVAGINLFNDYETCICMSTYYMSDSEIVKLLCDGRPDERLPVFKRTAVNGYRAWPDQDELLGYKRMLEEYCDCYEKGIVRQVLGRVRPYTYPREIFLFQRQDFSSYFGDAYEEFKTIPEVYRTLGITHYRDLLKERDFIKFDKLRKQGHKIKDAAKAVGRTPSEGTHLINWAQKNLERNA